MQVVVTPEEGEKQTITANLEAISRQEATILFDDFVAPYSRLEVLLPGISLRGTAQAIEFDELGHYVTMAFDKDCRWTPDQYLPSHLLDLDWLFRKNLKKVV